MQNNGKGNGNQNLQWENMQTFMYIQFVLQPLNVMDLRKAAKHLANQFTKTEIATELLVAHK